EVLEAWVGGEGPRGLEPLVERDEGKEARQRPARGLPPSQERDDGEDGGRHRRDRLEVGVQGGHGGRLRRAPSRAGSAARARRSWPTCRRRRACSSATPCGRPAARWGAC